MILEGAVAIDIGAADFADACVVVVNAGPSEAGGAWMLDDGWAGLYPNDSGSGGVDGAGWANVFMHSSSKINIEAKIFLINFTSKFIYKILMEFLRELLDDPFS